MSESRDAARPPSPRRRRRRSTAPGRAHTEVIYKGLDRFGVAPVLLLVGAYFVYSGVVHPLAIEYADVVRTVGENNRLIKSEMAERGAESARRLEIVREAQSHVQEMVASIKGLSEGNRGLNEELRKLSLANRSLNEEIQSLSLANQNLNREIKAELAEIKRTISDFPAKAEQ